MRLRDGITVALPTIPPRTGPGGLLWQAVQSVQHQTLRPVGGISVALDVDHAGAAVTRQRALDAVHTTWTAFLDDDDLLYPQHLEVLSTLAREHDADYAYSWFDGNNPFPMHRGRQLDPQDPHHTTMTVLVKTELARDVGFWQEEPMHPEWSGEDWQFTLGCIKYGARFIGTGDVTWHYRVHGANTSGLGTRW